MRDKNDTELEAICKQLQGHNQQLRELSRDLRDRSIKEQENLRQVVRSYRVACNVFSAAIVVMIVALAVI